MCVCVCMSVSLSLYVEVSTCVCVVVCEVLGVCVCGWVSVFFCCMYVSERQRESVLVFGVWLRVVMHVHALLCVFLCMNRWCMYIPVCMSIYIYIYIYICMYVAV